MLEFVVVEMAQFQAWRSKEWGGWNWQQVPGDEKELRSQGVWPGIRVTSEGLPWWLRQWRICLQCRQLRFDPWVRKIPWRREWQPTPSILAWTILWTEKPGGLQSMGSQRVEHNWATNTSTFSLFEVSQVGRTEQVARPRCLRGREEKGGLVWGGAITKHHHVVECHEQQTLIFLF